MRGARPGHALELRFAQALRDWPAGPVVLACSGGADSVALAALAARAPTAERSRFTIVHVDHAIRRSSAQDETVTRFVAASLRLPLKTMRLEPGCAADEASLRAARYAALTVAARELGAATIATAHHARDQVETVLLALFRGTGLDGLAGMPPLRELEEGIVLARPLLRTAPNVLERYAACRHLPYARDPTNADVRYRRNRLRAALAGLREDFPGLDEAVARCAEIVACELGDRPVAALRREVRAGLRGGVTLRDVPFERIEAVLANLGRPGRRRVHVRRGVGVRISGSTWTPEGEF